MGTAVTDGRASWPPPAPASRRFVGTLDKAVQTIIELHRTRARSVPATYSSTNDPFYGGVTHLNDVVVRDARVRRRPTRRLDREHRPLERRRRASCPARSPTRRPRSTRRGFGCRRSSSSTGGQPIRSVMEIMTVNSRLPDFLRGRYVGRDRRRPSRRAPASLELVDKYGVDDVRDRAARLFMDYGERSRCARSRALPEGPVRAGRGAGRRARLPRRDRDHRRRVRRRSARQPGPGPGSQQRVARRLDDHRAR